MSSSSTMLATLQGELIRMSGDKQEIVKNLIPKIKEEIGKTNLYYMAFEMAKLELELMKDENFI